MLMSSFSENIEETLFSNMKGGLVFSFSMMGEMISRYPILVEYSLARVIAEEKIGILSSYERLVYSIDGYEGTMYELDADDMLLIKVLIRFNALGEHNK